MTQLLLEIGTEEIPAGYILPALDFLSSVLSERMRNARIGHGKIKTYGTPRRLAVFVDDVAERQASLTTEIMGPPVRIAFDAFGGPTAVAQKFAQKIGVPVTALTVKETDRGRYVYAGKTERGLLTKTVLKDILPDLILSIPFPKTMRWSDLRIGFARPIHSICAMFGKNPIPFQVGNIKAGRFIRGHRFMHPQRIRLQSPDQYLDRLSAARVLADIDQRKAVMKEQMSKAAEEAGGRVLPDSELVDTVANLIEYPAAVIGRFDAKYLNLPSEILITAMREHQKYFAVVDRSDALMPFFVAVNNTLTADMSLVARGHERVLKARLEDAQFFFNSDLKVSLEEFAQRLRSVVFQAELGSVYDKTRRVEKLALAMAEALNLDQAVVDRISRAARLCKADLVSHVVIEFPKLQGTMGRIYAIAAGEPANLAAAIEEHYRPTASGGLLPETVEGAILSIADKIDTLCGCFSAGLIPTGTSDPYALRRQGIGLIQIALEKGFSFSIRKIIDLSMSLFSARQATENVRAADGAHEFLKGRMAHLLEEAGISKDSVSAVLSVSGEFIPDTWKRAHALQRLKQQPDFEVLAIGFKRVVNIIKKADPLETESRQVDPALFAHESENRLYEKFTAVNAEVLNGLSHGDIEGSFAAIATLRGSVDRFFDDVMVMVDDARLRRNRLALLGQIAGLFERLVDFSKIST